MSRKFKKKKEKEFHSYLLYRWDQLDNSNRKGTNRLLLKINYFIKISVNRLKQNNNQS